MRDINSITGEIVDAVYRVHSRLGPGLVETAYRLVLAHDLSKRGLQVEQEKQVSFVYEESLIANAFRVDLLVEEKVVVELKSVEKLAPVHTRQILTYLRLLDLPIGLLANFGGARMNDGLRRIVNDRSPLANATIVAGRGSR
jgi:GxxExxY protein